VAVKTYSWTHPAESAETTETTETTGATAICAHVIIHECALTGSGACERNGGDDW